MSQRVILLDVGGYTNRLRCMKAAWPYVTGVTPPDKPCEGFAPVEFPEDWLPEDHTMDYGRVRWYKAAVHGLAAVKQLNLRASHYWFIESDCCGTPKKWRELLTDHALNDVDMASLCLRTRRDEYATYERGPHAMWKTAPDWCTIRHLSCIFRLSRRAVEWCIDGAPELRNVFGEMIIPNLVRRAGGSFSALNLSHAHMTTHSMKSVAKQKYFFTGRVNPALIHHPVKMNTVGPLP